MPLEVNHVGIVSTLNFQQKQTLDFILSNKGFYILTGSAGTEKSFVINGLKSILKEKLLVVTPTGKAAANFPFFASTLHSVFRLGTKDP